MEEKSGAGALKYLTTSGLPSKRNKNRGWPHPYECSLKQFRPWEEHDDRMLGNYLTERTNRSDPLELCVGEHSWKQAKCSFQWSRAIPTIWYAAGGRGGTEHKVRPLRVGRD